MFYCTNSPIITKLWLKNMCSRSKLDRFETHLHLWFAKRSYLFIVIFDSLTKSLKQMWWRRKCEQLGFVCWRKAFFLVCQVIVFTPFPLKQGFPTSILETADKNYRVHQRFRLYLDFLCVNFSPLLMWATILGSAYRSLPEIGWCLKHNYISQVKPVQIPDTYGIAGSFSQNLTLDEEQQISTIFFNVSLGYYKF